MPSNLTLQIATLLLAAAPINLGLIFLIKKFFLHQDSKFAEIKTISTPAVGILTQPKITVRSIIYDQTRIDIQKADQEIQIKQNASIELMAKILQFCHYPKIAAQEKVIKNFFTSQNIAPENFSRFYRLLDQLPVIEGRKISSSVVLETNTEDIYAFCKGNPYTILSACRRILIDDKKIELTPALLTKIKKKIKKQLDSGHKLMAFAFKALPRKRHSKYENSFIENDLIFVGFIGLGHFIRPGVRQEIKELRKLGLEIYLDEGENDKDTLAIAHDLKINKAPENLETTIFRNTLQINEILHKIRQQKIANQQKIQIQNHTIKHKTLLLSILIPSLLLQAPLPFTILFLIAIELIASALQLSLNNDGKKRKKLTPFQQQIILFTSAIFLNSLYFWQLSRFGWEPGIDLSSSVSQKTAIQSVEISLITATIILAFHNNQTKQNNLKLSLMSLIAILIGFYFIDFQFPLFKPALITLLFIALTTKITRKYV